MRERLAKKNPRFGNLAVASAIEAYVKRSFSSPLKAEKEARRRSPGDSGVDSPGVLTIAAAHESVLSVLRGATTNYPAR